MQQEEITAYIVKELVIHHNPKDIALTLCEKTKMPWSDAEKLVRHVQSTHGQEIAVRQSPLLIIFSVGLLVVGLGSIVFGISIIDHDGSGNRLSTRMVFIGIGMILGGIIGLWNTIASLLKGK